MITCGGRSSESDFQGAAAPTSGTLDPHGGARRATPLSVWHYGPTLLDTAARSSTCLRFRHAARSPAQCPALANVCGTNEIVDGFLSVSRPFNHRTRVRMVGLCAALAVALSLGLVPLSSADTAGDKKKLDANIAALRIALEGTSQDLAKAFLELQRTKALLPRARQELTAADAAQSVADRHNQTMAAALAVAEANASAAAIVWLWRSATLCAASAAVSSCLARGRSALVRCSSRKALARSWEVPSSAMRRAAMLASSFFLSPAVSAELRGTSPRLSATARAAQRPTIRTRVRWLKGRDTLKNPSTISLVPQTLARAGHWAGDRAACLNLRQVELLAAVSRPSD